jgi:hypothetical protein
MNAPDLFSAQEGLHIVNTHGEPPRTMKEARFPRTLEEAFGPYATPVVHTAESNRRDDGAVLFVCAVAVAVLCLLPLLTGVV